MFKFETECSQKQDWNQTGCTLSPEEEKEYNFYKQHFDELTWSRSALHRRIPPLSIYQWAQIKNIQNLQAFIEVIQGFDKLFIKNQLSIRRKKGSFALTLLE